MTARLQQDDSPAAAYARACAAYARAMAAHERAFLLQARTQAVAEWLPAA